MATSAAPARIAVRGATIGLGVVLVLLSLFAVLVAAGNARGTERASRAVAECDLFERATEALHAQEESAEEVVADDTEETRSEYAAADTATRAALRGLNRLAPESYGLEEIERLRALHVRYGAEVEAMFVVALRSADRAEHYEEAHVDPHFDPLAAALSEQVKVRYEEGRTALVSIERSQQVMAIATPTVFGVALLLLAMFIVLLGRSRRLVEVQAEENRYQSLHDALTGLPNRTLLHRRGTDCIGQSAATGRHVALMLLDLDRFKKINDTLGHHYGDLVLKAVTERLRAAVRSSDIVTRLGGDEFAILLPQVQGTASALDVAAQVQESLRTSIEVAGVQLDVGASMGVALSGLHGDDIETLLQHADIAMYRAKEHDLGVAVYDDDLNECNLVQLGLLGEFRQAINDDQLFLDFQPKFALPGGEFCGAEALLRWQHPTRDVIPPDYFIPAVERTALIRPLTLWVLNAALTECRRWHDDGRTLVLAVNISARNLLDPSFGDDVLALLAQWEMPPSCLVLEVTESAIMIDTTRAEMVLRRFAELGIEIAVDDFGAGYTSLGHLRTLPVRELKIDQSLVRQMASSATDTIIIKAIIDLAHGLGLRTVAEGVEDAGTLHELSALGCDIAQGFHLGRPMSAAALVPWSNGAVISERISAQGGTAAIDLSADCPGTSTRTTSLTSTRTCADD